MPGSGSALDDTRSPATERRCLPWRLAAIGALALLAALLPLAPAHGTAAPTPSPTAGSAVSLAEPTARPPFEIVAPAEAEAPRPHYTIRATLDYSTGRLTAHQTVVFSNTTGRVLTSLVFYVVPAHFRAFALAGAQVDGASVAARLEGTILEVPLPAPLAPGASAVAALDFALTVPRPGNLRFGFSQGVLALGNWYPVLAVWRGNDWDRHRYTDVGDAFHTDVADYEVTLRTAPHLTVAHTGELVNRAEGTWLVRAQRVRDFALAVSERYERQATTVDGIALVAYFLPEHRQAASEYLATGAPLLRWANANLGRYPYPTLTIAETSGSDALGIGQEYPGLVFISTAATASGAGRGGYLSYLVAHELVHQWFYGVVGGDQIYEPWVDEAFATYLPYLFFADEFPSVFPGAWGRVLAAYRAERERRGSRPVNSTIYDFADDVDYFAVVYRPGAVFLDELRTALGDARFRQLLKQFVARYEFQTPRGTDFLDLAQASAATDLTPLFRSYFRCAKYDPALLDYPIPNGWFFKQTNGQGGAGETGYAVTDDGGVGFWSQFQRGGSVAAFGYPLSRRFVWDGFAAQAFQKAIFQWRPESGRVAFVNVLDLLSAAGRDDWLLAFRQTPRPFDAAADAGLPWEAVVARRLALLDPYPAIRARFFAEPAWLERYGLPVSTAELDSVRVVRSQRAVLQQWKVAVPWAAAGEVTIANGGELAKEAGLLPADALPPEPSPTPR